jgi:cell wall-associated NlpC family hydrolase
MTDVSGNWMKIETLFDNYTGWIDLHHLQNTIDTSDSKGKVLNRSLLCFRNDGTKMVLEAGCEVFDPDFMGGSFRTGKNTYTTTPEFSESYISVYESIADTAMKFINSPYIWGGRVPSGIDCSGFTQLVYKIHGNAIARDSWKQAEEGKAVDFITESEPGDLVFFDNERGRISHVGMILSQGLVIHASGRVRIDSIDHQGIFKKEINGYSHRLRMIRRIV